jgi:glycopeptide antibiotics resistance protein
MVTSQALLVLVIPLAAWILVRGIRRSLDRATIVLQLALLVYATAVLAVAFFPIPYERDLLETRRQLWQAQNNLVPLQSLFAAIGNDAMPSVIYQSIGNFVMLLPLGVFLPLLSRGSLGGRATITAGFGVSLAIECTQLGISGLLGYTYKIADIDDFILNTVGVAAGFIIYRASRRDASGPQVVRTGSARLGSSGTRNAGSRGGCKPGQSRPRARP